jgi:hypothetical protein
MKKYNIVYTLGLICALAGFNSCNDEFLEKFPETTITAEGYFKTPEDLGTYVNGLYNENDLYPRNTYDNEPFSDNIANWDTEVEDYSMLRGALSKDNVGGWTQAQWKVLRRINFLLVNASRATGNEVDIQHWIGIARYFRAVFYITQMQKYGDVPWYNKSLETTDPDVYKAADPRTLVADSIVADLEYASANIKADIGNRTAISRYVAQTLLTRFALYEGTYRKYHTELNLASTADGFLNKAVATAEQIISSGKFSITGSGRTGFSALFTSYDLTGNDEIILMGQYVAGKSDGNSAFHPLYGNYALSRSLMETFLMADGTRFTDQTGYATKEFKDVFVGRDPRFPETFVAPGFTKPIAGEAPYIINAIHGGYESIKYYPRTEQTLGTNTFRGCWTDLPLYRYAEVLLSFAEAKAELGTLTQADLDRSITLIRSRVQLPALNLATANSDIDPVLAAQYPNVSGANQGVILEIRRERRVELALEGQRPQDVNRWKAGPLMAEKPQGIYIPALGAYDVNGDNVEDIAILQNSSSTGPISGLAPSVVDKLDIKYLDDGKLRLSNGTSGYIMFTVDDNTPRVWAGDKYYYRPIPIDQTVMNPALKQPAGWE